MFAALSVRQRLLALALLPTLALLLIVTMALKDLSRLSHVVQTVFNDRVIPMSLLKEASDAYAVTIVDAVNKANLGLFSAEQAAKEVEQARTHALQKWKAFVSTDLTEEEKRLVQASDDKFFPTDAYVQQLQETLRGKSGNVSGQLNQEVAQLYRLVDPLSLTYGALVDYQLEYTSKLYDQVVADEAQEQSLFLWITAATLAIVVIIGLLVARSVIQPLRICRNALVRIERDNDFTVDLKKMGEDEFGQTMAALDRMQLKMRHLVGQVQSATLQLAAAAEQMANISGRSQQIISAQRTDTEQVATAMNEMTVTVQDVARNAANSQQIALDADSLARSGMNLVQESHEVFTDLLTEVGRIADTINKVEKNSVSIGSVVEVISSIADQTNLLALNAAIEASRAGEQGRGFAVVADEVRTLARRTQESTREISKVVDNLRQDTRVAVSAMEKGQEKAKYSSTYSVRITEALEQITQAVSHIAKSSTQIATVAEEQSAVAEDINRSIVRISDSAGASERGASEGATASEQLAQLAAELKNLMERFKVA